MRRNVLKKLLAFAISLVLVGAWWWMTAYALHNWNMITKTAVISVATFALSIGTRLVEAALIDPQFSLAQFIEMKLLIRAALSALGIATLFEIFEAVRGSATLAEFMLVVVAGALVFRGIRARGLAHPSDRR